jgi:tetratricopeptide (TPR) repeat protein
MPDKAAITSVLDRLAYLNYMQLDFAKAEKLYLRALTLREEAYGPKHLEVSTSLYNLAEFHRQRGNYSKAEPFYQRAIEIKGNQLGPEDKDVVKALERYSCLYYAMDQPEKLDGIRSRFSFLREQDAALVDKGEVLNGQAISLPKPDYPRAALANRVGGLVLIKVIVDETGKVTEAEDACGAHPLLIETSREAALKARFTPTLLSGIPVKVTGIITYRYVPR